MTAGLFKLGERVEWGTTVRGQVRRLRGAVFEIVPPGVKPAPPAPSRAGDSFDDTRDHESYIVRAEVDGAVRFYWPRVSALAPDAPRPVATDHDRETLRAAERHALEVTARECDALKTLLAYRLGGLKAAPLTRQAGDQPGPPLIVVNYWRDDRHPLGGVVEVVRYTSQTEVEIVAVYFARDRASPGPNPIDWLAEVGLR